jgi:hypothetical protein
MHSAVNRVESRNPSNHDNEKERRTRERLKVCLPVHIRPLRASLQQTEEVTTTVDFNRNGLCFATLRDHYHLGMALFLTFPYIRAKWCGWILCQMAGGPWQWSS